MFILLAIYINYIKAYLVTLFSINFIEVADLLKVFTALIKVVLLSASFLPSLRDIIEMEDLILIGIYDIK